MIDSVVPKDHAAASSTVPRIFQLGGFMPNSSSKLRRRSSGSEEGARAAIRNAAVSAVGTLNLIDAIRLFRSQMVDLALRQQSGSRRAAAGLLGVTRPAIQNILRQSAGAPATFQKIGSSTKSMGEARRRDFLHQSVSDTQQPRSK